MIEPPAEILEHARLINEWALRNGWRDWMLGSVASRSFCERILMEHSKMRNCLVLLTGTDDQKQLGEMKRMLPLLVADRTERQVRLDAAQLLTEIPRRDEPPVPTRSVI